MFKQFLLSFLHEGLCLISKMISMSWEATLNESFVKLSNSTKQATKQIIKNVNILHEFKYFKMQIDYLKLQLKMGLMKMKNQ